MAICGYDCLGNAVTSSADKRWITPLSNISQISLYSPVAGTIYDKVWGRVGYQPTQEEVWALDLTYNPTWTSDTYMLSEFNPSDFFLAGNFSSTTILGWDVHKVYSIDGTSYDVVVENEISPSNFTYYNYENAYDATYYVVANGQNLTSDNTYWSLQSSTSSVTESPQGYYLIDITNNTSYFFNFNITGGEYKQNLSIKQYDINQPYDAYYHGVSNYSSGQFSGILYEGNVFGMEGNSQTLLDNFKEFYNSKRPCILKDRFGNVKNVLLTEYGESYLNIYIQEQVKVSIISWKEVALNA